MGYFFYIYPSPHGISLPGLSFWKTDWTVYHGPWFIGLNDIAIKWNITAKLAVAKAIIMSTTTQRWTGYQKALLSLKSALLIERLLRMFCCILLSFNKHIPECRFSQEAKKYGITFITAESLSSSSYAYVSYDVTNFCPFISYAINPNIVRNIICWQWLNANTVLISTMIRWQRGH